MNNKGYDDTFLDRLKLNNDIITTIGRYVTLNQKGKRHWGCCPFHSEKTPSFTVDGLQQFYHCFGCSESGDVIAFIEKIENVDFMTAVKILADKAGMEVPQFVGDDNVKEKKQKKEAILKANKDTAIYYNKMLNTEVGSAALTYLTNKRGLNANTIAKFGLGVSPDWNSLVKHLKSLGYSDDILIESGLLERGPKGNLYDVMAERIMYPIINSYGEVIGFSGRALNDGKFAKYRNTAQTLVFDKSRIVYGINLLKTLKQKENFTEVILVEGQMDVIAMHSAGFPNVVACMGTALTKYHAKELKRFSDKVIVSFDGDTAGQKATLRSLEILEEEELKVYVVSIPEKLDPDEFIKKYGSTKFKVLLDNAMPLNDYKLKAIAGEFNLDDNIEKSKFIQKALEEISRLTSSYEREIYLKQLSEKTKVDVNRLDNELKMLLNEKQIIKPFDEKELHQTQSISSFKSAEFILASILYKKEYVTPVNKDLFTHPVHKKLYDFIITSQNLQKEIKIGDLFTNFDVEQDTEIKDIINYDFIIEEARLKKHFNECVKMLDLEFLNNRKSYLLNKLNEEISREINDIKNDKNEKKDSIKGILKEEINKVILQILETNKRK